MSQHEEDDWGNLRFAIVAVHDGRTPTKEPPFHCDGGDWTFLDCHAGNKDLVRFTVGLLALRPDRLPRVWGKAWLAVANQEDGARLLQLFADAFFEQVPTPRTPQQPLEPLLFSTANLDDLRQVIVDGARETNDCWHATKWFLEMDRFCAEVFFNYNLALMQGEFSEKDPDDREDLLGILALILRDGPRPARTPESDPNLTMAGPRIGIPRLILEQSSSHYVFSPGSKFLIYQDEASVHAVDPVVPDQPIELARFEHPLWDVHPVDDQPNLLVREVVPQRAGMQSSDDPMRVWWVDGAKMEKHLLCGPEQWIDLGEKPTSPDNRYIVLTKGKERTDQRLRYSTVCVLDRESGRVRTIDIPNLSLSPVWWRDDGGLRLVLVTNRWGSGETQPQVYLADPATGQYQPDLAPAPTVDLLEGVVSPDGRYLAVIEDELRLVLTDLATAEEREFTFHEDDVPFVHKECVAWLSSRYLQFHGRRVALIDVESMKMSFPASSDETGESSSYCFSPDLTWAVFEKETLNGVGLYLCRMISTHA